MGTNSVTVERLIKAPAAAIFEILATPSRHSEIDGSGTVKGSAVSDRVSLGSTFTTDMKWVFPYKMVNTIVEFEENRRIAWQPRPDNGLLDKFVGGRIWRYELDEREGGTLVKETWDISQERVPLSVRGLAGTAKKGMIATLQRIAQKLE